jgi:hypothetical protein
MFYHVALFNNDGSKYVRSEPVPRVDPLQVGVPAQRQPPPKPPGYIDLQGNIVFFDDDESFDSDIENKMA